MNWLRAERDPQQERRSPYVYRAVWALTTLFAILLLLWLAAPRKRVGAAISLSFTPPRSGHMGDYYSSHFLVALVTNATQRAFHLEHLAVQRDANGHVIIDKKLLFARRMY